MEVDRLYSELLDVARKLGLEVRQEALLARTEGAGSLCVVRGAPLVLIDARAPLDEKLFVLGRSLATLDIDRIQMAPHAREFVESLREGGSLP